MVSTRAQKLGDGKEILAEDAADVIEGPWD
ncbi:MAG: hypothetical protein QG575_1105 [Euryarchaeota archaeon]|nr:hypothetical protein [Euryarchaeota archaeon]